jgi:hypothetical protein
MALPRTGTGCSSLPGRPACHYWPLPNLSVSDRGPVCFSPFWQPRRIRRQAYEPVSLRPARRLSSAAVHTVQPRGVWRPWLALCNYRHPISWRGALHDCRSDQKKTSLPGTTHHRGTFPSSARPSRLGQYRLTGLCPHALLVRQLVRLPKLPMERGLVSLKKQAWPLKKHCRELLAHVSHTPRGWLPSANFSARTWSPCPEPYPMCQPSQRNGHRTSPASNSLPVMKADTTRAVLKIHGPAWCKRIPLFEMNKMLSASQGPVSDDRPVGTNAVRQQILQSARFDCRALLRIRVSVRKRTSTKGIISLTVRLR